MENNVRNIKFSYKMSPKINNVYSPQFFLHHVYRILEFPDLS